jgi:hypothetical protein
MLYPLNIFYRKRELRQDYTEACGDEQFYVLPKTVAPGSMNELAHYRGEETSCHSPKYEAVFFALRCNLFKTST